jgi:hypothetical protein
MSLDTRQQNSIEAIDELRQEHSSGYTAEELNRSIGDWQLLELRQKADECMALIDKRIEFNKQLLGQ